MAKQTIIIETAKDLSLRCGMVVIVDKESGEETLRPKSKASEPSQLAGHLLIYRHHLLQRLFDLSS